MNDRNHTQDETYRMHPIGFVRRNSESIRLEIAEPFRPALENLDHFSHVMVFWWADRFDNEQGRSVLETIPPYAQDHVTGVFATRSPCRPNLIMMTTCKLLNVRSQEGMIRVADIDAVDGTPIVDLKAYFPVCDRVREAHIPAWLADWPEWMPENGIGLEEGEA
jgi:tRNA-Thr(GGU) m(6)t(6)A37 methyltransferase TsaA